MKQHQIEASITKSQAVRKRNLRPRPSAKLSLANAWGKVSTACGRSCCRCSCRWFSCSTVLIASPISTTSGLRVVYLALTGSLPTRKSLSTRRPSMAMLIQSRLSHIFRTMKQISRSEKSRLSGTGKLVRLRARSINRQSLSRLEQRKTPTSMARTNSLSSIVRVITTCSRHWSTSRRPIPRSSSHSSCSKESLNSLLKTQSLNSRPSQLPSRFKKISSQSVFLKRSSLRQHKRTISLRWFKVGLMWVWESIQSSAWPISFFPHQSSPSWSESVLPSPSSSRPKTVSTVSTTG